jgi:hypothetical protein
MIANDTQSEVRRMTASEFAALGVGGVAYVRPAQHENKPGFAIHGADGQQIGFAPRFEQAIAAIIEHELAPVSVH